MPQEELDVRQLSHLISPIPRLKVGGRPKRSAKNKYIQDRALPGPGGQWGLPHWGTIKAIDSGAKGDCFHAHSMTWDESLNPGMVARKTMIMSCC